MSVPALLWLGASLGYAMTRALVDAAPMSLAWAVVSAIGVCVMLEACDGDS